MATQTDGVQTWMSPDMEPQAMQLNNLVMVLLPTSEHNSKA